MSAKDNKAVVTRWFSEFWGPDYNPAVIDELAAPDIRFEYSMHAPLRGRDEVRDFARRFRAAFPDCVAYGFFPQRQQDIFESWPLMHSADERLDVRDVGFATEFFADLPRRLLT